jgi:hypothetical protein
MWLAIIYPQAGLRRRAFFKSEGDRMVPEAALQTAMLCRAWGPNPPPSTHSVYLVEPWSDPPKARSAPASHIIARVLCEIGQGRVDIVRRENAAKVPFNIRNAKSTWDLSRAQELIDVIWKRHAESVRLILHTVNPL